MRVLSFLLLALALLPNFASAECPGNANTNATSAFVTGASGVGTAFIGAGCTGSAVGTPAAVACNTFVVGMSHAFTASWGLGNRPVTGTAGCLFNCNGTSMTAMGGANNNPSCFVQASDGLPVELLEFSIGGK